MSFNLFGPVTKNDIRVGYISTERGFVDGVSICEANDYAKKNPGTTFIFRTRNVIKYLGINEVNKLTENDLLSDVDSCTGISLETECGPPRVYFYGGGGVGVQGNPIIGEDGAVLAVDLVYGGNGYQYAPIVEVKDRCGIGVGAVARAILGEVVEAYEVYDKDEDFEDYELCLPEDVGYGRRYDPNGKEIGSWDPTLYANLTKDPINREIQNYQDFIQRLSKPWWTTRKEAPLRMTSPTKVTRTKFNVTDKTYRETQDKKGDTSYVSLGFIWNDFMNKYAISPVPPSNVPGSDFGVDLFTFEWEEDFPYDGEYIFRGCADGAIKDLYLDNEKLTTLASYNESPAIVKRQIPAGVHRIRLDLKNGTIIEPGDQPQQQEIPKYVDVEFSVYGQGGRTKDLSFLFVSEDGVDSFVIDGVRSNKQTKKEVRKVRPNVNYKVNAKEDSKKYKSVEQGLIANGRKNKEGGVGSGTKIFADYIGSANDNDDIQVTTSQGNFTSSNKRKGRGGRSTYDLTFKVSGGSQSTKSVINAGKSIFNTAEYIGRADRKLWKTNPVFNAKDADFATTYGVLPFDPNSSAAKRQSYAGTHLIRWANVEFPVDGNYVIETWTDDSVVIYIGNRNRGGNISVGNGLNDIDAGGDEVIIRKNGFTPNAVSTGKSIETRFFKAGKYRIRAELTQSDVGPLGTVNPMSVSINITIAGKVQKLASSKSWNDNPMGVALTIDAPLPPIPQEPIPLQEGRCPNNPIWSTRFPGGQQKWWPVSYNEVLRANGITPWSNFLNRYAISPVPPLSTPGSDAGGIVHKNSWQVDIPYDGFYKFAVQRDETARIYLDGNLAFDIKTAGDMIWKDFRNKPKFQKVFITKGLHTISVELENSKTEIFETIDKKVFSTKDWLSPPPPPSPAATPAATVTESTVEEWVQVDDVFVPPKRRGFIEKDTSFHRYNEGTWYKGKQIRSGGDWNNTNVNNNYIEWDNDTRLTLGKYYPGQGSRFGIAVWKKRTRRVSVSSPAVAAAPTPVAELASMNKNGVIYSGPPLANYLFDLLSPRFNNPFNPPAEEIQGKSWVMKWSNVDFFEDGQYTIVAKVDDILEIKIDGTLVDTVKLTQGFKTFYFNTTKGKKTIEVKLSNLRFEKTSFKQNPVYFSLDITKKVSVGTGVSKSWVQNPVAISAILIPPPCPKRIRGKGVVTNVVIDDPGNGYIVPQNDLPPEISPTYPVSLRLSGIVVENPGINYNCGVDRIEITPSNGAVLDYECDTFGRITNVKVLNGGLGFTRYPSIRMVTPPTDSEGNPVSPTGVNASFRPQFEVVRDPIVVDQTKLIQVTDLAGLEKTGYVDGRAYYGAVFYKEGVRYAGFYETPGDLVQVYDTLKESIDAQVTTPASAIQREGTSINSNNPRLNLPNTPENLI